MTDITDAMITTVTGEERKRLMELYGIKSESEPMNELQDIDGVDEEIAQALHDHGYDSKEEIQNAEQMELAGIEGIGNALAVRMKADVGGLDDDSNDEEDEAGVVVSESIPLTFSKQRIYDFSSKTCEISEPKFHISDDDVPIEVGEDVDEITLVKDGEEVDIVVGEVFDEEGEECTCDIHQTCSECYDGEIYSINNFTQSVSEDMASFGEKLKEVGGGLEVTDIDTESIVDELEEDEEREICSARFCENWASECEKH